MSTHVEYLQAEKAIAHSKSNCRGAGKAEFANYMIAAARYWQACQNLHLAHALLLSAADVYAHEYDERVP